MDVWFLTSGELSERMVIERVVGVRNRLRWYGHVERKEEEDSMKECMYMEVEGARETKKYSELFEGTGLGGADILEHLLNGGGSFWE